MTATPYITLAQVRYLGAKVASDQAGKPSNRAKLLTLAIPNSNRYACIVPEKEGNEFGDSQYTRAHEPRLAAFFVQSHCIHNGRQWRGYLRVCRFPLVSGSPTLSLAAHPFGDGRSIPTHKGVCHGWITHI